MHDRLDRTQRRILGVLAEKELTTPNLYPLTLNALVNGCNQKNTRNPVLHLQEFEVEGSLKQLFLEQWVTNSAGGGSRTIKWKHRLRDRLGIDGAALAVMTELLLRGPQSPGALRGHVNRMADVKDLEALSELLAGLERLELVHEIPPAPGERSRRWDHRLYPEGEVPEHDDATPAMMSSVPSSAAPSEPLAERVAELEKRLARIERELGLGDEAPA